MQILTGIALFLSIISTLLSIYNFFESKKAALGYYVEKGGNGKFSIFISNHGLVDAKISQVLIDGKDFRLHQNIYSTIESGQLLLPPNSLIKLCDVVLTLGTQPPQNIEIIWFNKFRKKSRKLTGSLSF